MNTAPSSDQHVMTPPETPHGPWPALWALIIGFFMILIDTTIVSVANPSIQHGLGLDVNEVIWVTSAYLLAYSVPMLVAGRLGDRFGPKRVYLVGLVIFTLASLWCGLSGWLPGSGFVNIILARTVQGLGGALMTPQTMAVVQRVFPPHRRGSAMAVWGSVAGLATLVGPLLGGLLVDSLGWEWIFVVNVPIGVIGFVLAVWLVPDLTSHRESFDWVGVALSAIGVFLLVFGIQEGNRYDWNVWVVLSIIGGVVFLIAFVLWQRAERVAPLVPLQLFRDRNFSVSTTTMTLIGLGITAMFIPLIYYFQIVRGLTPTQSALMTLPASVLGMLLAPISGRLTDRVHPRLLAATGTLCSALGMWAYLLVMHTDTPWLLLLVPSMILGLGNAFMWGPVSATATRNLPMKLAGAASGVFNTARQMGGVIGAAAIAAVMTSRLDHYLPGASEAASAGGSAGSLPEIVATGFTSAMSDSIILPAVALTVAGLVALLYQRPNHFGGRSTPSVETDGRPAAAAAARQTD